jgi:hypothetical protein
VLNSHLHFQAEILEATPAKPFLSFVLQIDPSVVRQVTSDMIERRTTAFRQHGAENEPPDPPAFVSALDQELAGAVLRFLRSIETGADRRVLAPMYVKEMVYRVLQREQYARLLAIAAAESASNPVSAVLEYVRGNLTEPLTVADMAEQVSLSPSAFAHLFREVTGRSPYQFVKEMRLDKALALLALLALVTFIYQQGHTFPGGLFQFAGTVDVPVVLASLAASSLVFSPGPRRGLAIVGWRRACLMIAGLSAGFGFPSIVQLADPAAPMGDLAFPLLGVLAIAVAVAVTCVRSPVGRRVAGLLATGLLPSLAVTIPLRDDPVGLLVAVLVRPVAIVSWRGRVRGASRAGYDQGGRVWRPRKRPAQSRGGSPGVWAGRT